MTWWCAAIKEPWSWAFRFYPGIWIMMALVVGSYVVTAVRHARRHGTTSDDRRKRVWFALGALLLWGATDWPLGTLGAGYLASAHMLQYMLYTLAAAPLLLLGTPDWMARPVVERLHLAGAARVLARPVVAAVAYNLILVGTHAPWTVDTFRSSELGSMGLDLAWLLAGLILWTPLVSPLKELRAPSPAVRCVYLFLASATVPMIPGGFLTFADFPLYRTYELAPRVHGIGAIGDQQTAGMLMNVGIPIVWTVMTIIFCKWALSDRDPTPKATDRRGGSSGGGAADGLSPGGPARPTPAATG